MVDRKRSIGKWLFVILATVIGIGLMAYPFIANYIFEHRQDSIIGTYEKQVDTVGKQEIEKLLEDARQYNKTLFSGHVQLHDPFSEDAIGQSKEDYMNLLSVDGSEVMGYIDIPCIGVSLPIYHGTSNEVLQKGAGHLEGTSVPVGGENVHTVLTGHTGLSSAKIFTDLTEMEEGDIFILRVLGQKLAYKVYDIKVILPDELSDLSIEEGKDLCTLITCTPYGVNTHRLLVMGERTEYTEAEEEAQSVTSRKTKSQWMSEYKKALLYALILIIIASAILIPLGRVDKEKKKKVFRKIVGILIILGGIIFYLYPDIQEWRVSRRTQEVIREFEQRYSVDENTDKETESETEKETVDGKEIASAASYDKEQLEELYREMQAYNKDLVEFGQNLADAWSYEQTPVDLDALGQEDSAVGYIEIPDMEVTLPLYIGASDENMALGAAVMSETSMPIGGKNTNSVIVGHRGYGGAPYFRDIESLKEGSMVYITNPWGKLSYRVSAITVIEPHETEPILIQPGRDMITLLTCHPYMSHGKFRYVVYCVRDEGDSSIRNEDKINDSTKETGVSEMLSDAWQEIAKNKDEDLSQKAIRYEGYVRKAMPVVLFLLIAVMAVKRRKQHKQRQA